MTLLKAWRRLKRLGVSSDAERCFRYNAFYGRRNHLAFVGDSRTRQLYLATRRLLETGQDPEGVEVQVKAHSDLRWESGSLNLRLDFYWAPQLNGSMDGALRKIRAGGQPPSIMVLGAGTWAIKEYNNSVDALEAYKKNLTRIKPVSLFRLCTI